MLKTFSTMIAAACLALTAMTASAIPFVATPADTLGPLNGGSVLENVVSPGAGSAVLTFDLLGYKSVDGANGYQDIFRLDINGSNLFTGSFNMGGGGATNIIFQDPGVTVVSTVSYGLFRGGLTQFAVNHNLLSGNNSYLFDYGVMQGLHDEGWGLRNIVIRGTVSDVPEANTVGLLILSLAMLFWSRKNKLIRS
ncbi:PEP-CTERM domain protein [Psychromonas aquimarina]|uniref:PEP-CTERM domain protein n=1 Tax=Psychromonas aquimarina TaxID=444919 RepID=UPI0003FD654C|nr:PEP-CTERM domain protein [Psychromonas aquimarina]